MHLGQITFQILFCLLWQGMIRFDNSNLKVLNIFNNIFDSGRKLFELRRFFINLQNLIKVLYLLNAGIWWITYYWLLPIWYPHLFLHDLFLRLLRWINFLIAIIEPYLFWFSNNKLSIVTLINRCWLLPHCFWKRTLIS